MGVLSSFCFNLFGDSWSPAFFGALTSVGALFVLYQRKKEENGKMNFKEKISIAVTEWQQKGACNGVYEVA